MQTNDENVEYVNARQEQQEVSNTQLKTEVALLKDAEPAAVNVELQKQVDELTQKLQSVEHAQRSPPPGLSLPCAQHAVSSVGDDWLGSIPVDATIGSLGWNTDATTFTD